jgi:hypothetical protein
MFEYSSINSNTHGLGGLGPSQLMCIGVNTKAPKQALRDGKKYVSQDGFIHIDGSYPSL